MKETPLRRYHRKRNLITKKKEFYDRIIQKLSARINKELEDVEGKCNPCIDDGGMFEGRCKLCGVGFG